MPTMRNLEGKIAIVTGASRGIGPHIARALAARGARLVLAARSMESLEKVAGELRDSGYEAFPVRTDIAVEGDRKGLVNACIDNLGPPDILVNNAGIETGGPFHEIPQDDIVRIININLTATMLLTHDVLPHMVERKSGHIVNIASLAGKAGVGCNAPYSASKFGLLGFTQSLRLEHHGTGVSASAVCPGFISEAGMWADAMDETGVQTPGMLGASTPEKVAKGVIKAIRKNKGEVLVNPRPVRPMLMIGLIFPSIAEWMIRKTSKDVFRDISKQRDKAESANDTAA